MVVVKGPAALLALSLLQLSLAYPRGEDEPVRYCMLCFVSLLIDQRRVGKTARNGLEPVEYI
jgi:hypothetical protein